MFIPMAHSVRWRIVIAAKGPYVCVSCAGPIAYREHYAKFNARDFSTCLTCYLKLAEEKSLLRAGIIPEELPPDILAWRRADQERRTG